MCEPCTSSVFAGQGDAAISERARFFRLNPSTSFAGKVWFLLSEILAPDEQDVYSLEVLSYSAPFGAESIRRC